ncbi:RAB geranylgeranyl transferase alpha subunit [Klebsormidium nitens]|uniref:Geranylgeranyl transferase type-2 subunit alpha n=1 Tax=Klebsormidium nitens TaxID=105231 RepID=A0A1Y1HZC8_KLENI|nr:RAB geranylgeranyl transferase alpha subunit [Klebsormidium nitens]|eukprot:GAQ84030.1 RAB geranylgeranyl transferase alpha subunit [Klebsormidium nitens]
MHGRARVSVQHQHSDAGAKEAAKDKRRAAQYAEQLAEVLRSNQEKDYGKEAVEKSAALLKTNPDMYTAWNYRKLAIKMLLAEADDAAKARIFEQELVLIFEALQVNPKAYGAWYHRKWILQLMGVHAPLQREFKLLDKLLKQDERNFHGWAYRRFLVRQADAPDTQEMAFVQQKIDETFSNFSAWHYRSKLLTKMHLSKEAIAVGPEQASAWLEPEFELVDNALFTDPNDTSAWIYQAWLLQNTVPNPGSVLTGMWPPSGVTVPLAKPPTPSSSSPTLPAILSFSKPVSGVNRHTVPATIRTPEASKKTGKDWTPVGSQGEASKVWVQELPAGRIESAELHVHVGAGPGIRTAEGVQVVRSASSGFSVRMVDESDADAVRLQDGDVSRGAGESDAGEPASDVSQLALPGYAASSVPKGPENGDWKGWREELFARQLDLREQQEELEQGKSKWILLGKARLLAAMRLLPTDAAVSSRLHEEQQIYRDLFALDPAHAEYYGEMLGQLRLEEITADRRQLESHMVRTSRGGLPCLQLRLRDLGLRRLGALDALLWVQHLDLSRNALRSVEGLEALQLLRSLDLSHNRISHASGLAALHLLPHLRWLSLASNQLGASPVDTQFYSSGIRREVVDSGLDTGPRELQRVFGGLMGLSLDLLELGGNEITQVEGCEAFIRRILPRTSIKL